jgi:hypothetical protein
MCKVCQNHVKEGLEDFDTPHVEKLTECKGSCQFCSKSAKIDIFYSLPIRIISELETE